jgi:hypothetical protein
VSGSGAISRILWQRLDNPGYEWCQVSRHASGLHASGVTLVALEGDAHRVEYSVEVDVDGRTRRVRVTASGPGDRSLDLVADGRGRWTRGGTIVVEAMEEPVAVDVDLGFSPFTNSLPMWRLSPMLAVGESAEIRVAWVLFPGFEVVEGRQWYDRLDTRRWRYRSGTFQAELALAEDGLVDDYPGIARAIARA